MKKKQRLSLSDKSVGELLKLVSDKKLEIAKLTLKGSEEKNTDKARQLRHEIATILTTLRQKELNEPLVSIKTLPKVEKKTDKKKTKTVKKSKSEKKKE